MPKSRIVERDARDFDTSSLHAKTHGLKLHRDYSAHFFRWSFARRFIKKTDHVLEVGCGDERPLWRMLFNGSYALAASYTGVDLNPLNGLGERHKHSTLIGEFDFTHDWRALIQECPTDHVGPAGWDVAVNMEVIEHMKVAHGKKLLHGLFELLRPGGTLLLSTPVYDGVRHAANHIHEYTVPELKAAIERAGFVVQRRFGTFMDVRHLKGRSPALRSRDGGNADAHQVFAVAQALGAYYDNDALSCIMAPLFPDYARNNLWVCRKPETDR